MTWLMWVIKNPKEAIIGALAFVGAALYALLKLKSAKVEKLKDEVQVAKKETEVTAKQSEQVAEIKDSEPEEIILKVKENAKKTKSDRVDNW
jgi:predicted Holliday junction resolvase-like endonuclease